MGLIDPTAASGFDLGASDYERGRPDYPVEVGALLAAELAIGLGSRVCDLAAGTGKFTRLLLGLGCDVVAVEPVAGMRAQLAEVLPGVEIVDGTAESMPLADGSADAVTVAQAFHWFHHQASLAEIHRVLRPGSGLALVWNRRDERVAWVGEMSRILEWHDRPHSNYERTDWAGVVAAAGGFTPAERREVEWEQPMTRDLLEARVRSISYVAAADGAVREEWVRGVLAMVEGMGDEFHLPYVTHLYWCHRQP
ncbi:MAG: class I SAM-dependent methyltransferase [Acidimicrobiales bacterium]